MNTPRRRESTDCDLGQPRDPSCWPLWISFPEPLFNASFSGHNIDRHETNGIGSHWSGGPSIIRNEIGRLKRIVNRSLRSSTA